MQKSSSLYILIISTWAFLVLLFLPSFFSEYRFTDSLYVNVLITLNGLFIMYFWLNGTKDLIYVFFYYLNRHNVLLYVRQLSALKINVGMPRIELLYCTCNDFDLKSLEKCMRQSIPVKTVILDDSSDERYISAINRFKNKHPEVRVVRRKDREGFKAGNINSYLYGKKDYDYFVVLDSDEIIPKDFCKRTLRYFKFYKNVGIVQATHIATRNRNGFMGLFHHGVNSHWPVYQGVKHSYGFMSMLGHGAIISREAYESVEDGFPELVAEDLCFSIELRNNGYYVAFAEDVVCEEEYPVDYLAFKKRHNKWTQGNLEFIKEYTARIMKSKMSWFEKLDIILFTYNLPLTTFFSLYIAINIVLLPLAGYLLHYPAWLLIPTIIFFIAPMLNDFVVYIRNMSPMKLVKYMLNTFLLYGSMLFISLKSSFLGIIGRKATFIVTPKDKQRYSISDALLINYQEIIFAILLSVISFAFTKSIFPVIAIVIPTLLSFILVFYSNYRYQIAR